MDLPTYTNIWRIEKRLYKLYDLRLPMPLPLVQIGVFAGVFLPWILLLRFVGIPFHTPWHVLYLVPPGVLTWLATRPVIEGKRLTELLLSHGRYLTEPRSWCRLTPIREPREVVVVARVWRRSAQAHEPATRAARSPAWAVRRGRDEPREGRRGHVAPQAPAPVPARAGAWYEPGTVAGAAVTGVTAQPAGPPPLQDHAAHAAYDRGAGPHGGPGGTAPASFASGAAERRSGEPAASWTPGEDTGVAAVPRPSPVRRAASAWRPTARRDISHEPDMVTEPPPGPDTAGASGSVPASPPPVMPRLETPPALGHPGADDSAQDEHGTQERGRGATASSPRPGPHETADAADTGSLPPSTTGEPVEADATEAGRDEASGATPAGSGKRALASGVRRPGAAAEFWKAITPPGQEEHRASPEAGGRQDPSGAEPDAGVTTQPDIPMVPGAFGASSPVVEEDAEDTESAESVAAGESRMPGEPGDVPEAAGQDPSAAHREDAEDSARARPGEPAGATDPSEEQAVRPTEPATEPQDLNPRDVNPQAVDVRDAPPRVAGVRAAEPQAPEGEGADRDGTVPRPPQPEDTEAAEGVEPAAEGSGGPERGTPKEPPKPWSEGLSRPLRDPARDALVWPPRQGEPGAEARPGTGTRRRTSERAAGGTPSAAAPYPPAAPAARNSPPPATPATSDIPVTAATPGIPAAPGAPGTPFGQPPSAGPQERGSHGAAGTREGPHPDTSQETMPDTYAPPREARSAPASPVRQRPLAPHPAPLPEESAPAGPGHDRRAGGLRRLVQAIGGGHGQVDSEYEDRLRRPFQGSRHIVVLGCTGGAGQTVTALMLGHTFAQHGSQPVVAIDVNPGPGALARRTRSETNATLTGLITRADQVNTFTAMRRYTSHAKSGLDVITAGKNPLQALDDRDYALAIRTLDRFYSVTMLDTAAAVVARVLPYADQIVLVAPASADAPRAVAMTFEWLDGHGYDGLRSHAVTVINGVSRRSMDDVEQAEAVARGRCRALVRIPWDDHLSLDRSPRNELKSLRAPTRRAYLALAGVVAGGFAAVPERYRQQEVGR